ncbi:hypothetical protein MRS44_018157 [Fusarium solani]|uniref:uncharacterized protein n=1 Tax=Fusarium solani TaxID=169388 RepID=UPI0032C458E0|nr:hypothetical protein MRS44_018157 [Fusarium solani]
MEETAFDNEDFAEVKMAFNRAIGELKKRPAPNKVARVMMQIEPLYLTPQQKPLWIFETDQTGEAPRMNTEARRRNSVPNYCQPENIDPSLTLLSTTSRVFEGAQETTLSCVSEARHLAADTPDMFTESWVFGPREHTCEGCPLQDSSRSVAPLPSQVDQETTMPVPDQTLAVCHIHPEQQQCQYGVTCLASETGHNQGITDIMNQQRGSTRSIADFPSDWPEGAAPTIIMPWDPSFIFYGGILAEPLEQGHLNYRELLSDAPDGEVRVPDDWEMAYATGEENLYQGKGCLLYGIEARSQRFKDIPYRLQ